MYKDYVFEIPNCKKPWVSKWQFLYVIYFSRQINICYYCQDTIFSVLLKTRKNSLNIINEYWEKAYKIEIYFMIYVICFILI